MRLESALYSGASGLQANGAAVAVTGDNVANANTTAFKGARVEFVDLFSDASGSSEPGSIQTTGNGVAVGRVRAVQESGAIEATGRALDVAIDGSGFLLVGDAAAPEYTRAGTLAINEDGNLVDGDGRPVLGIPAAGGTTLQALDMLDIETGGIPTTLAGVFGNLASNSEVSVPPANPQSFREINAAASFVAPSVRVYDSLGAPHDVTVAFFKGASNTWTAQAYMDAGDTGGTAGTPIQVGANAAIAFSASGVIEEANKAAAKISATPAYGNGAAAGNFTIDLSSFTQFAGTSQLSSVQQDGFGTGQVKDYEIGQDGVISAVLDSGSLVTIGTLQLATAPNLDGLERAGRSSYTATELAGTVTTGNPGSNGFGAISARSLERSTVDFTREFTNLILYQRGIQAASQIVNTAGQIMRDTLGMLR